MYTHQHNVTVLVPFTVVSFLFKLTSTHTCIRTHIFSGIKHSQGCTVSVCHILLRSSRCANLLFLAHCLRKLLSESFFGCSVTRRPYGLIKAMEGRRVDKTSASFIISYRAQLEKVRFRNNYSPLNPYLFHRKNILFIMFSRSVWQCILTAFLLHCVQVHILFLKH